MDETTPALADWRRSQGWHRGRWALAVALLGLAALLAYRIVSQSAAAKESERQSPPPLVTIVSPASGTLHSTVSVVGVLAARNEQPIGPEGEGGRIAAVFVEVGDRVKRGAVLARLDPLVAESQVAAVQATLDEQRAAELIAVSEYARAQRAADAFSIEEAERRRMSAVSAASRVKLAEAQLAEARTRWSRTQIVAPNDAIVLTRNAEVGQVALPGAALFRLAFEGEIEMRGRVAEQDIPQLQVGQAAEILITGVSHSYSARVWQIGAIIDSESRQGSVRLALQGRDLNLRPGAFARAEVRVADVDGLILPQTAVLADDHGNFTWVVGSDDTLQRRALRVRGPHQDGVVVERDISPQDRVVATAGAFLRAGEKVAVANPVEDQPAADKPAVAKPAPKAAADSVPAKPAGAAS